MRHPALLLLALALAAQARAQVGEPRRDLAVGLGGGVALNRVSFTPSVKQGLKSGMTLGLTARYTCEKYFNMLCALQGEVNLTQLGWREVIETSDDRYERTVSYIQVPLLANLGFGRERGGVKGFLALGPQVAFAVGESEKRSGPWDGHSLAARPNGVTQQYGLKVQRKFEYGLTGGLGMDASTRSGHHLVLEGRYYFALSDMFKNSKRDPFGRSANGAIIVKLSYLFDVARTKRD